MAPKYTRESNWGENTSCESEYGPDAKAGARPRVFCDTVECASSLTVQGPTTMTQSQSLSHEVVLPQITVGGKTYRPVTLEYVSGGSIPGGLQYSTIEILAAVPPLGG